jgi:hypothetical protein
MTEIMKGYKIRNKETGEFSKGGTGTWNLWTDRGGKTWSTIGALKNHLNQFMWGSELKTDYPYQNAEIVEVEIKYEDCHTYDVNVMVGNMALKKSEQSKKQREAHEAWLQKRELERLAELQRKYPQFSTPIK